MDEFYCLVEGTAGCKVKHPYQHLAKYEAERLARLNPGKKVFVLETIGFCQTTEPPVEWVRTE